MRHAATNLAPFGGKNLKQALTNWLRSQAVFYFLTLCCLGASPDVASRVAAVLFVFHTVAYVLSLMTESCRCNGTYTQSIMQACVQHCILGPLRCSSATKAAGQDEHVRLQEGFPATTSPVLQITYISAGLTMHSPKCCHPLSKRLQRLLQRRP
jgi:hypothetical protein